MNDVKLSKAAQILTLAVGVGLFGFAGVNGAKAETPMAMPDHAGQHDAMAGHAQHDAMAGHDHAADAANAPHHGTMSAHMTSRMPTLPGQDAFGAIQEIVQILDADPATDWSKVRLDLLRKHLIDMNELTLHAVARSTKIPNGLSIEVTGQGRTLEAIRDMLPTHAGMLDGFHGWHAKAEPLEHGVRLVVSADDAREAAHIRGLGFIGLMTEGAHHQVHHMAIARGEMHY